MRKFKYTSNFFYKNKKKQKKNTLPMVKGNVLLNKTWLNQNIVVHNGRYKHLIENVNKYHLKYKIGDFVNTRTIKKK